MALRRAVPMTDRASRPPFRIALLGAESTGKSTLASAMAERLRSRGHAVSVVDEVLRDWCARAGRLPRPDEAEAIAREQEARVDAAPGDLVIADSTALMVAVHAALLFPEGRLQQFLQASQRRYDLTLLMGLDLPWVPDGLHREGPQVQQPVDTLLREQLQLAGVDWRVVYGLGESRTLSALEAVAAVAPWAWSVQVPAETSGRWARLRAQCEKCGDADCEHRLFTGLNAQAGAARSGSLDR